MLTQSDVELRLVFRTSGTPDAFLYHENKKIGSAKDLERINNLAKFAKEEDRNAIAAAELRPLKLAVINALGFESKEQAETYKISPEMIVFIKETRAAIGQLDKNRLLISSIDATENSIAIKKTAINLIDMIKIHRIEEFVRYLKGKPTKKEDKALLLLKSGISGWAWVKFSNKLEIPLARNYNFARVFFPKITEKSIAFTLDEWKSKEVLRAHAAVLDTSQFMMWFVNQSQLLEQLTGITQKVLSDMNAQDRVRHESAKYILTACYAKVEDHIAIMHDRKTVDALIIRKSATGAGALQALANTLHNVSCGYVLSPEKRKMWAELLNPAANQYIQYGDSPQYMASIFGYIKLHPNEVTIKEAFENLETALRLYRIEFGWSDDNLFIANVLKAIQAQKPTKTVVFVESEDTLRGPLYEALSKDEALVVEPKPLGPIIDLAKEVKSQGIFEALKFPKLEPRVSRAGERLTSLGTPAKAYVESLREKGDLRHLAIPIGDYLRSFETEQLQDLAVRRLKANLETFISDDKGEEPSSEEED